MTCLLRTGHVCVVAAIGLVSEQARNEVGTSYATQRLFNASSFLRLVPEEELALGLFLARAFGREYGFERIGVVACVPCFGGIGEWRWRKVLNLLEMEIKVLGNDGQLGHILLLTARVTGDEVGDDLLAKTFLAIDAVEDALELVELRERGLAHEIEHAVAGVLGGYLESARNMTGNQLAGVLHSGLVAGLVLAAM